MHTLLLGDLMKKFILVNSILIFLINFPLHFLYERCPNFLTSLFVPVNESIFEHMKMIFTSYFLAFLFSSLWHKENWKTYLFSFLVTSLFCITLYLALFLPIYFLFGENMVFTILWLFLSIVLSNFINYHLSTLPTKKYQTFLSFGILLLFLFLSYTWTYHPPKWEFFKDPTNASYGILKDKK